MPLMKSARSAKKSTAVFKSDSCKSRHSNFTVIAFQVRYYVYICLLLTAKNKRSSYTNLLKACNVVSLNKRRVM